MKVLNNKFLKAVIGMIAFALLFAFSAAAQNPATGQLEEKEIPLSEFNALNVEDDFEVTVCQGAYGIRLTVDTDLAPYIEKYVKAKTLYISYDEKSVPKDVKKLYKGKGAQIPVFRVVVYVPTLESITLSDNVSLTGTDPFLSGKFELELKDKAQVKMLNVSAQTAKIAMRRNTQAVLNLTTERGIEVAAEGNANLKLTMDAKELVVKASNSAVVAASGKARNVNIDSGSSSQLNLSTQSDRVDINAEGSSKLILAGEGAEMKLKASRSANLEAVNFRCQTLDADLSGSAVANVDVVREIKVCLVGGSALYYSGTPSFRIEKIVKSTLAPIGTK